MLKTLRIERFKSIHDQTLEFGKVNLFIGPNGSGKSNVLEAMGVLSAALSQGIDPVSLDLRGVRLSLPHLFKSAFKNHDLPKTFRLEAEFEFGRYECSIRASPQSTFLEFFSEALYDCNGKVFGRSMHGTRLHSVAADMPNFTPTAVDSSRSVWSAISPFVRIDDKFRSELDEFSRFAIYAPQTAIMRGLAVDNRVVEPLGLTGSGLASALNYVQKNLDKRALAKILEIVWKPDWTNMVQTGPFNERIVPGHIRSEGMLLYMRDKFMHAERNMLSAFDASEGTLYLIFVASLLGHKETPNVFALDNVDGTLNPRLVRNLTEYVIDIACEGELDGDKQVFMTSHHPSSLDAFDIYNDMHRIHICARNQKSSGVLGSTTFKPLLPPKNMSRDDWILAHKGHNLSELFLENRIPGAL